MAYTQVGACFPAVLDCGRSIERVGVAVTATVSEVVGVPMGFKENLRRLREARGWTQGEAARQASVPFRSYQNWEIGGREPRLEALVRLAAAFGVSYDELLEGVGEPEPPPKKGKKK